MSRREWLATMRQDAVEAQAAGIHAEEIAFDVWDAVEKIQRVEKVDLRVVTSLAKRLDKAREWPDSLSRIVIAGEESYMLLDGHHRFAAVLQANFSNIPVLLITSDEVDVLEWMRERDYARVDFVEMIGLYDPLIRENLRKGRGGKPKVRTAW